MEFINKKISIFLACNLFLVTLIAVPKFDQVRKSGTTKVEISTTDNVYILGYTKTEITSSPYSVDQSLKVSKALKYFHTIVFGEFLQLEAEARTNLNVLFFTGSIQLALKALIFPFHTFW